MARKNNLKGLDAETMDFIDSKMNNGVDERYTDATYNNCSKALNYKINLKCKNLKQKEYHNLIKEHEIVFCFGSAGSGKSYISLATALELLKENSLYKKIIIIVPTCEASTYLSIGLLPGTYNEKISPYLEADTYTMEKILNLSGNIDSKKIVQNMVKCELIDYQLVNFARGKTFDNSIILINEAENYSKDEMLLLLTRIGENVKVVISGDQKQLDRKDIKKTNEKCGLMHAINSLQHLNEVGVIEFNNTDIVRNPIISKILESW